MRSGSFMFRKETYSEIGAPKNLWFDTSHDLFSLIYYFDLFK